MHGSLPPESRLSRGGREFFPELLRDKETRVFREEEEKMSDLQKYVRKRKKRDPGFAEDFEAGYEQFKIEVA